MVLRIRRQSHQVHLTMLQYYTCIQYTERSVDAELTRHPVVSVQPYIAYVRNAGVAVVGCYQPFHDSVRPWAGMSPHAPPQLYFFGIC